MDVGESSVGSRNLLDIIGLTLVLLWLGLDEMGPASTGFYRCVSDWNWHGAIRDSPYRKPAVFTLVWGTIRDVIDLVGAPTTQEDKSWGQMRTCQLLPPSTCWQLSSDGVLSSARKKAFSRCNTQKLADRALNVFPWRQLNKNHVVHLQEMHHVCK